MTTASCLPPSIPPSNHSLHSNISLPTPPLSVFQTRSQSFRLALEDILTLPFPLLPTKTPQAHLLSTSSSLIPFQLNPPASLSPPSTRC